MVEFNRWKNQEMGLEREMEYRQNDALIEQERLEAIKVPTFKITSRSPFLSSKKES